MRKRKIGIQEKGLAVVTSTPEVWENAFTKRQVARTLGMMADFGHPDIEVLYRLSDRPYHHPLLSFLYNSIKNGTRYQEGDRITFEGDPLNRRLAIEFKGVVSGGEYLLRAVILDLDIEYQALPTADACNAVFKLYEENNSVPIELDLDDFDFFGNEE